MPEPSPGKNGWKRSKRLHLLFKGVGSKAL